MKEILKKVGDKKKLTDVDSDRIFSSAFVNTSLSMALVSLDGDFLKVNKSFCNLLGYTESELLSTNFQSITHPDDLDEDIDNINKVISGRIKCYSMEKRYFSKNGKCILVLLNVSPVFDEDGDVLFFIAYVNDISHKDRLEKNLELIVDNSSIGFWEYDIITGECVSSDGIENIFGIKINHIEDFYKIIHPSDIENVKAELNKCVSNHIDYLCEYRVLVGNKIVYSRAIGRPIFDKVGNVSGIIGFNIDLTEERNMIEKLNSTNQDLEHFNYVTSHDLQEPLRSISSFADLLELDISRQNYENAARYCFLIKSRCKRMSSLISDLSVYSKCERYKSENLSVLECLVEVVDILDPQIKEKSSIIKFSKGDFDFNIFYPKNGLFQILQNLIGNAVKYDGKNVEILCERYYDYAMITIKDDGIGIENEFCDKIFKPFVRLNSKDKYGGSGLGLSTCKKVVELNYGNIGVYQNEPKGCCFWFTFPLDYSKNMEKIKRKMK